MRINVYAEELTSETGMVKKRTTGPNGEIREFYGIRLYLASPDNLHHTSEDDDRSAITLWVPWTKQRGHDLDFMHDVLNNLFGQLGNISRDMEQVFALRYGASVEGQED